MTHEAHEQPELQTKKKLRRPETEEKVVKTGKREQVDGPFEVTALQPEETAEKGGSENNKTEKRGQHFDEKQYKPLKRKMTHEAHEQPELQTKKRDIYDHYILGELLGYGSFGCVYAGVRISDGKKVALKIMNKINNHQNITIAGDARSLPVEVALLELVCKPPHCPFVIQLLEWFETPDAIILVLERPDPCVDLFDFLTNNIMTETEIIFIVQQIVLAACHCRNRGVFHRDIKAENVLLNPLTLQVKLIDFGLGVLHKDTTYTEHAGTDIYIPPECYVDKEYEAEPFTVWGLGVLSYILLCRMQPFDGEKEIVEGHLFIPDELSKASQDFIGGACKETLIADQPSIRSSDITGSGGKERSNGLSLGRTNLLDISSVPPVCKIKNKYVLFLLKKEL
ncbi:hypothetical protein HF521_021315 [Silurus meridionalis]|uniref:non-specific serine/threonine protein kinase n=1 Tax=Silurus meridionalis TaxID=175797 RepID=A0A8T0BDN1_SILME|nr:hypothetical protein HF521_021315 [Silurus meridionalis]